MSPMTPQQTGMQPLRNYLNQVSSPHKPPSSGKSPNPNHQQRPEGSGPLPAFADSPNIRGVQDSTGIDFDFKEKIKDSTYPSTIQSGFQQQGHSGFTPATTTSRFVDGPARQAVPPPFSSTTDKKGLSMVPEDSNLVHSSVVP